MRVTYDPSVDALSIRLSDAPVDTSDELQEGVVADYDAQGRIIALEIFDASNRVTDPSSIEFAVLTGEPEPEREIVGVAQP